MKSKAIAAILAIMVLLGVYVEHTRMDCNNKARIFANGLHDSSLSEKKTGYEISYKLCLRSHGL